MQIFAAPPRCAGWHDHPRTMQQARDVVDALDPDRRADVLGMLAAGWPPPCCTRGAAGRELVRLALQQRLAPPRPKL